MRRCLCFTSLLIGLLISGVCLSASTNPHQYFKNLDSKNGLSQNTVNAILQDRTGFVWFGTKDGLNRFDGQTFRVFKSKAGDLRSLGSNFINVLLEDANGEIWVGTDAGVFIYNPGTEAFRPFRIRNNKGRNILNSVSMICSDKFGRIWIGIESQGLFCFDPRDGKLKNYRFGFIPSNVNAFSMDERGRIWIGFYGNGLYLSTDNLKTIQPYASPEGRQVFRNDIITRIVRGRYNCFYIGSVKGGLKELNLSSGQTRDLLRTDEHNDPLYVRDILAFSKSELWVGTESGIYVYDLDNNTSLHLTSSENDPYSLSDNAVYSLCKDRESGVWIGSYFGGINYLPKQYTYFEKYYSTSRESSLHGRRVREFCQDNDGTIWIGTEDGGLNSFDPKTGKIRFIASSKTFSNIHGLCPDGDKLWVGTFSKGLKVLDKKTGAVLKTYLKSDRPNSLNDNSVFSICKTSTGDLYLATIFGLSVYNRKTDDFTRIRELDGKFVYDIKEDTKGNLWLATYSNGAFCLDANRKKWTQFLYDSQDIRSLPNNKVLSIFEDGRGQIWLTTQGGGFCRYVPEKKAFVRYNSGNGFPGDVVYQIAEDNQGLLWITTNNGLVRFNPKNAGIKVFTVSNGLLNNQFNYRSSLKTKDGKLYFGSLDGFIAFNPSTFTENKHIPPAVITEFLLFNKPVAVGGKHSPLKQSITISKKLTLTSRQNSFSFRLAALSYQALGMNQLVYKLEGFDKEWYTVKESPLVNYSNLSYGNYVFRVKASNNDGIRNDAGVTLNIEILPPFYLTIWAFVLYFLLAVSLVLFLLRNFKKKVAGRHQLQMEKFENEKEKEVYKAKIDFFTNVAHEIRTPLTLIKGPLDSLLQKKEQVRDIEKELNIMSKNTSRLLNLTNQLLDFRKTETQGFRLIFTENNVTELLRESYLSFSSMAAQKGLDFTLEVPPTDLMAHLDKEAFIKIISNLFSNAVKYAGSYIRVRLEVDNSSDNQRMVLHVDNDGVLIPDSFRENIFQPFVRFNENDSQQLTTGTGIGLALSRSLAELHHGLLFMERIPDCNSFCLQLPVRQDEAILIKSQDEHWDPILFPNTANSTPDKSRPVLLLVEDNPDMLAFVSMQLADKYTLLSATNGVNALDMLDKNYVNLVISDIMMPQMDGFELCRKIKSTLAYSHIPVILLTARTNLQSKIEGMELGADAYIEKPFPVDYLQACVANLLQNREKLRETFTRSPFIASSTLAMTRADEDFLNKINEIISGNIANSDFSMDEMAEVLHMSRASFYRKIKETLDLNPSEYLRLERLKKAAVLLRERNNLVNEVCYMVGFNSPSYFSKCFLKQFGVLPKDFAAEGRKE